MENFRMYESSNTNILEELKDKAYIIEDYEIQDVINRLYKLVEINEDYIDEAILTIETICDNNEEFKKEWFGALDEVESEVLEESKLSKLASIALLALSMGISLTGCDVSPQLPQEPHRMETNVDYLSAHSGDIDGSITDDRDNVDDKEENNMEETNLTYDEIKDEIRWWVTKEFISTSICVNTITGEVTSEPKEYVEIELTDEEKDDRYMYNNVLIPTKVVREKGKYGMRAMKVCYSIGDGEIKDFDYGNPPYTD